MGVPPPPPRAHHLSASLACEQAPSASGRIFAQSLLLQLGACSQAMQVGSVTYLAKYCGRLKVTKVQVGMEQENREGISVFIMSTFPPEAPNFFLPMRAHVDRS